MPIEIRELHIRVSVGETGKQAHGAAASPAGGGGNIDKDAVIAECVEQVMEVLKSKKER